MTFCDNHYNTKTVVLVENGVEDQLVPDQSRERFLKRWMMLASIGFSSSCQNTHGFALPPLLDHPGDFTSLPTEDRHKISCAIQGDFS